MPKAAKIFLAALCFQAFFLPFSVNASESLLSNPGFENGLNDWLKYGSQVIFSSTDSAGTLYSGSQSGLIKANSNSTGNTIVKYLYQIKEVKPSTSYELSGWSKLLEGNSSLYLRATECQVINCSLSFADHDSSKTSSSAWEKHHLKFTTKSSTIALKIKTSLDPDSTNLTSAVWDEILLQQSLEIPEIPSFSSSSDTREPEMIIDFTPPSNLIVGEQFSLPVTLDNLENSSYFLKVRIGHNENNLNDGQTLKDIWLDDNDSWLKFPQIGGPNWQGTINARLPENKPAGVYKILIRLKKIPSDKFLQSDLKEIKFQAAAVPSASNEIIPDVVSTEAKIPPPNPPSELFGSVAGQSTSASNYEFGISRKKSSSPSIKNQPKNLTLPVPDLLVASGLFIIGFSATVVIRTRS